MVYFMIDEPAIEVPADEKTLVFTFGVTPLEARFLQAMLNTTKWVGKEELPELRYSLRQIIYTLRAKLEGRQIWVVNNGQGKYSITPACKEIIKRDIEAALPTE